jgi:hypothetical protein
MEDYSTASAGLNEDLENGEEVFLDNHVKKEGLNESERPREQMQIMFKYGDDLR